MSNPPSGSRWNVSKPRLRIRKEGLNGGIAARASSSLARYVSREDLVGMGRLRFVLRIFAVPALEPAGGIGACTCVSEPGAPVSDAEPV